MIEDDIYRTSSQFRLWSYTEASLRSLRANTNALASQRVRAALRRARPVQLSAASSPASTPDRTTEDKEIECLTPDEEQDLIRYYCEKTLDLGDLYEPVLPTAVRVCPSLAGLLCTRADFGSDGRRRRRFSTSADST